MLIEIEASSAYVGEGGASLSHAGGKEAERGEQIIQILSMVSQLELWLNENISQQSN